MTYSILYVLILFVVAFYQPLLINEYWSIDWSIDYVVIIRVHFSADLSLWLDSPMFWAPWHQSISTYTQPSFSSSTWKRGEGMNVQSKAKH